MTQELSVEDKLHKAELMNSFWTMVVHDMKGPIQAELSALNFLIASGDNFTDEQKEILNDILSSSKYLKNLVFNVLQKYKDDNGNVIIKKENHSFKNLIKECCDEVKYISHERNLSIKMNYNTNFENLFFDVDEIKRVIHNVLTNALKYSYKDTEVIIDVIDDGNFVNFSITNFGVGIKLEHHDNIFDKFISYSEQHKSINTGLGLYISKNIIDAHHGKIHFDSVFGEKTTVTFTLPINPC